MTAQFLLPNIEGAGEADRGQVAAVLSSTQRECTQGIQAPVHCWKSARVRAQCSGVTCAEWSSELHSVQIHRVSQ